MSFRNRPFLAVIAGLCLCSAASSVPLSAEPGPQSTRIVLANFSFTPADLQLDSGKPVVLHFVNEGSGGHNFVAPEFFAAAQMDEATRARLGRKGVVELAKGESLDVALTPVAGAYKVKCTHFLHAGFGMTGTITVK